MLMAIKSRYKNLAIIKRGMGLATKSCLLAFWPHVFPTFGKVDIWDQTCWAGQCQLPRFGLFNALYIVSATSMLCHLQMTIHVNTVDKLPIAGLKVGEVVSGMH